MSRWNLLTNQKNLSEYTELRAQENLSYRISLLNGQVVNNTTSMEQGISARTFRNGSWGFASHPQISAGSIEQVLAASHKNANYLSGKRKSAAEIVKLSGAKARIDLSTKKAKLSSQELIDRMNELEAFISNKYPQVSNRTLTAYQQDFIKEGINSEGSDTYSHYARSYVVMALAMNSENGPVEIRGIVGDAGQMEDNWQDLEQLNPELEVIYKRLLDKTKGIRPEAGVKEVILDSRLAGILAHEAVGHTTEADIVLGGSVAGPFLGQQVASPMVSLVDFAHTAFGKSAPMPVLFDDEGTMAEDTVIIDQGILKTFMNNKESAQHFSQKATGHARAWAFNDEPLIRMRNTAILPGKDKLSDMISSIKDGYYLIDHGNGQADSTSEFMFSVPLGYEIKNGKLGKALLDTTISGVAFEMLKSVSMVSDETTWVSYGTCGKKQPMTVGMGGPAIKCKVNLGGR